MNTAKLKMLRPRLIKAHADEALEMTTWALRRPESVLVIDPTPGECGTALCAAGWAAVQGGWKINWVQRERTADHCYKQGRTVLIEDAGAEELELTVHEARAFFYAEGPEYGQDVEFSEVIRVLDALILWSERMPESQELEGLPSEHAVRDFLLNWYATQHTAA